MLCWYCTAWQTQLTWRWGKYHKHYFTDIRYNLFDTHPYNLLAGAPRKTHVLSAWKNYSRKSWQRPFRVQSHHLKSAPPKGTSCSWRPTKQPVAQYSTSSSGLEKSTSWSLPSLMGAMTSSTHRLSCAPRWKTTSLAIVSTLFATTCALTMKK